MFGSDIELSEFLYGICDKPQKEDIEKMCELMVILRKNILLKELYDIHNDCTYSESKQYIHYRVNQKEI